MPRWGKRCEALSHLGEVVDAAHDAGFLQRVLDTGAVLDHPSAPLHPHEHLFAHATAGFGWNDANCGRGQRRTPEPKTCADNHRRVNQP